MNPGNSSGTFVEYENQIYDSILTGLSLFDYYLRCDSIK